MSSSEEKFVGYACHGKGQPCEKFEYVPRPLGEEDVEVKISHCGICHSDIHTMDSGWGPTQYPCIVGHEIVGHVTKAGPKSMWKVGDRVGVGCIVYCCQELDKCEACRYDNDQYCPKAVFTYNAKWADGHPAFGGYQERVRLSSKMAFKLPENLPSDQAAPLLCAGATVYAPLARWKAGSERKRVGVVGLGGLGHFAVQFAAHMGAEVTVISTSTSKKEDAIKLGAKHFVVSKNEDEVKAAANSLDLVINTVSDLPDMNVIFNMMAFESVLVQVGAPEVPLQIPAFPLLFKRLIVTGSLIGSRKEIEDMLELAAKKDIKAMINKLPMEKVNEGIQMVRQNKTRYRVVLENPQ